MPNADLFHRSRHRRRKMRKYGSTSVSRQSEQRVPLSSVPYPRICALGLESNVIRPDAIAQKALPTAVDDIWVAAGVKKKKDKVNLSAGY